MACKEGYTQEQIARAEKECADRDKCNGCICQECEGNRGMCAIDCYECENE